MFTGQYYADEIRESDRACIANTYGICNNSYTRQSLSYSPNIMPRLSRVLIVVCGIKKSRRKSAFSFCDPIIFVAMAGYCFPILHQHHLRRQRTLTRPPYRHSASGLALHGRPAPTPGTGRQTAKNRSRQHHHQ